VKAKALLRERRPHFAYGEERLAGCVLAATAGRN
jgi:hypothetical protein